MKTEMGCRGMSNGEKSEESQKRIGQEMRIKASRSKVLVEGARMEKRLTSDRVTCSVTCRGRLGVGLKL